MRDRGCDLYFGFVSSPPKPPETASRRVSIEHTSKETRVADVSNGLVARLLPADISVIIVAGSDNIGAGGNGRS